MSRPSTLSQRNLTLTEELEKLEQSITLTLQEIDHNFNRAHRIVTSSILPIVQQYADHSQNVWEGSKFWKQFFEASANVSLNGYEERPAEEETGITEEETSHATPSSSSYTSPQHEATFSPSSAHNYDNHDEDNDDDISFPFSPDATSTPRAPRNAQAQTKMATYASPYEKLRQQMHGASQEEETPTSTLPSTPRGQTLSNSIIDSSPIVPPSTARHRTPANDVLLHRVLDKNYRIQATPLTQARLPRPGAQNYGRTPTTGRKGQVRAKLDDLDSSPLIEAPKLNSDLFGSPAKERRIPGISVMTPAKKTPKKAEAFDQDDTRTSRAAATWDSDSDDEGWPEGMSPPKTMQFHIPQSKLLKTPAREASKRIVDDLLLTAGGGDLTDDLDDPNSPSVIGGLLEEETF